ncbi:MAG: His/Gly/Thr/Pro-type tRNA ligase C-terminal domain-containing protein [Alphaproteobacteria bacterium]|nr:His/Gly/Thr/Pro-type tRNA ligase C-terminal domain-containing protein [Alphaproteobacteria bacterium]
MKRNYEHEHDERREFKMKIENLCVRRRFEESGEDTTKGYKMSLRAGIVYQTAAGLYTLTPLGCCVLRNIENIIRSEMNAVDGQEILMPVVAPAELWKQTGRYDSAAETLGIMKFKGRSGGDFLLSPTHEESTVDFVKSVLESYRQLPFCVYQIQTKYRDELRVRSGLIRTREFIMKDAYSFHATEEDLDVYYERQLSAYYKIYKRCGLKKVIHVVADSGDMGGKVAHEFQLINETGEDTVYVCKCKFAANKEGVDGDNPKCPKCFDEMDVVRGIEVGNIFKLGYFYSESMNLEYMGEDGKKANPIMGCYGIGVSRILASILEESADENGPVWNMETAPYAVHVVALPDKEGKTNPVAEKIYNDLSAVGIESILDMRDARAGEKFADADLIAAPIRLIISTKNLDANVAEVKYRVNDKDTGDMPTSFPLDSVIDETKKAIELLS